MVLSLIFAASAPAQTAFPPSPPAPPPVLNVFAPSPPVPAIVRFRAGPATCRGQDQRVLVAEEPFPTAVLRAPPAPSNVALHFRIDADGRPLGIVHERSPIPGYSIGDVPAAFAAWRFAPGAERRDCTIVFTPVTETVAAASPETLFRFLALHPISGYPRMNEVGRPAFERARPAGSTCYDPRPNVRLLAYPPFEEIGQPLGTVHFSWVSHDIGPDGRTRNVRLLAGSGLAALDRATVAAISRSRFQPGARTGCLYHFWRRQNEPMPAPPAPEEEAFRREGATCPADEPDWAYMPPLEFPSEFNRRAIEGWAILSYDLAPWGQTGNVKVLAAEPASAFGEQAARIVSLARTAAGGSGYAGCTARVLFRLPADRPQEMSD